jgi:hypothetical protein
MTRLTEEQIGEMRRLAEKMLTPDLGISDTSGRYDPRLPEKYAAAITVPVVLALLDEVQEARKARKPDAWAVRGRDRSLTDFTTNINTLGWAGAKTALYAAAPDEAARLARLERVCGQIRWAEIGIPALDSDQTKAALLELCEILFAAGLAEATRSASPKTEESRDYE